MTASPQTATLHDTLATAAERMWTCDCGALPVVNDDGVVVAMITDRDICMATWSCGKAPAELRVEAAMSRTLIVCRPADALETAEAAMRAGRVRRLPVVDDAHRLLGILSLADIALSHAGERGRPQTSSDGLSTTLAIICEKPLVQSSSSSNDQSSSNDTQPAEGAPKAATAEAKETEDGRAA